jgi:hypothetical protein
MLRDSILQRFPDRSVNFWSGLTTSQGKLREQFNAGDGIHVNNDGHRVLYESMRASKLSEHILAPQREFFRTDKVWAQAIPLNLHGIHPPPPKPRSIPPRTGTLLLRVDKPLDGAYVEIFNAAGKLVRKGTYNLPAVLKTDFGPRGVYRIRIKGTSAVYTQKWIKPE